MKPGRVAFVGFALAMSLPGLALQAGEPGEKPAVSSAQVSYYRELRPIFQAHCQGCHQPAKAKGGYVMTAYERLLAGGESEKRGVVPHKPEESQLVRLITPTDGKAEMPQKGDPLAADQIALIRRWIEQGAVDDTPANARQRHDAEHPPVYTRPPVITALDMSPDGQLLAVSGFHEVFLHRADGSGRVARLVGLSERIESVRFSPDGAKLAVTGGLPARMGEVQIWDVAGAKLLVSVPATFDTVYGAGWSSDGSLVAFGCADNSVRAIDAATGRQVLYQRAPEDWVLDTVFSTNGDHVVAVGRDMTAKLIEVRTQRFVDNITSITPGVLKGGIHSVARHPSRDEILVGGSDGVPQIFRMFRETKRVIGDNANLIRRFPPMPGRIFGVAYRPDGRRIAAGSSAEGGGRLHIYSSDFESGLTEELKKILGKRVGERAPEEERKLEEYQTNGVSLAAAADVGSPVYALAWSPDGRWIATGSADGVVRLFDAETAGLVRAFVPAPVPEAASREVVALGVEPPSIRLAGNPDYIQDVMPVISRLGCNAGTCHGAKEGKNGFKLSLRGYDPVFDVRAFSDDLAARRVNLASPDDSLILLKATAAVPHEGGRRTGVESDYYQILRGWVAAGCTLDLGSPRVRSIEVLPANPVAQQIGSQQQFRVLATYTDGRQRDVTREAFLESGEAEVAKAGEGALVTALRRGEAPILARFEGAYAATTLTVMGERAGFVWKEPPVHNRIDELVAAKWKRVKVLPSDLCTDAEFIRRVSLDLTGLPPGPEEARAFLADGRERRIKREALIDRLIGSEAYVDHWANKWADLLQVNRKFLGTEGAAAFRAWIRNEVKTNTPYDVFARRILMATGSSKENPAVAYYKILREPEALVENTTQLFLATRFNCNKCHDHPFERWTQDQYYQTAAYFAQVGLKKDPAGGDQQIEGTAVDASRPLYEIVFDKPDGEMRHGRTGQTIVPTFPFSAEAKPSPEASRRERLAAWMTSPTNPYFARSYVNRVWGYLTGRGLIEPLDDIRAGNPPSNPELLQWLTDAFIQSGFNVQELIRVICQSRTYQLSIQTQAWNEDDPMNYSHALPRRLPAEVLFDAIYAATGSPSKFPGVPEGTRAAQLPDAGAGSPDGFLGSLGRPPRESACECERSSDLQLGPIMALMTGPTVDQAISDPNNAIAKLVAGEADDRKVVEELYWRILNRPPATPEIDAAREILQSMEPDHTQVLSQLQAYRIELAPLLARKEEQRQKDIAQAKAEHDAYQQQIAPREAELDRQRQEAIANAEKALQEFEETLPQKVSAWEQKQERTTVWIPLAPAELKASHSAQLTAEKDHSVFASGNNGPGVYTVTAETALRGLTAFRLEALADERLPKKGPGRADDGNFVVTELEVTAAPKSDPGQARKVILENARADFSQEGYDVTTAVDGQAPDNGNGWAVHPEEGKTHVATFEIKEGIDFDGGTMLTFSLQQKFASGKHALGRFRISVSTSKKPVDFGMPEAVASILQIAAAERSPEQIKALHDFVRSGDPEWQKRQKDLQTARQPRPIDPQVKALGEKVARVGQPLPPDPKLQELERAVQLSAEQLKRKRLTAAQDVAWALLNSPAFLFNH